MVLELEPNPDIARQLGNMKIRISSWLDLPSKPMTRSGMQVKN
jgi:hypothetical protein